MIPPLTAAVTELIDEGYSIFLTGGAQGFDTLAAEVVLSLKVDFPHIQLHLVLPYADQAKSWRESERARYERIKQQADEVRYISKHYSQGCLHRRNRFLVEHSSVCISYLCKDSGGTFYTVNYAEKNGLLVINLAN